MKLTLEQRVNRNVTRRNNRLKKQYPMFAAQWQITPAQERDRLLRHEEHWQKLKARLAQADRAWSERAAKLRTQVAQNIDSDTLRLLDEHRKIYPPRGVYAAEFWHTILKHGFRVSSGVIIINWGGLEW